MKLKIKAGTVEGILSPIAISKPITNLEIPKNKTWKRIGILATLKEAKISLSEGGKPRFRIIIVSKTKDIKLSNKNSRLSPKLMNCSAKELASIPIKEILTKAAITKSWYISIMYLNGMLQNNPCVAT